jgi:hypothetical protein
MAGLSASTNQSETKAAPTPAAEASRPRGSGQARLVPDTTARGSDARPLPIANGTLPAKTTSSTIETTTDSSVVVAVSRPAGRRGDRRDGDGGGGQDEQRRHHLGLIGAELLRPVAQAAGEECEAKDQ